jgi:sortase (surface protein transpeptidase)
VGCSDLGEADARLITVGELDAGGSKARYGNDRGSERPWR